MLGIFEEEGQLFAINADFFDKFILSRYFYRPPFCPIYLAGVENYRGELFPVLNLAGLTGSKRGATHPKYLLLLNENFNVMLSSSKRPIVVEDGMENVKVDIRSEFEEITKGSFIMSGEIVYELDMKKVLRKISDFQKKI